MNLGYFFRLKMKFLFLLFGLFAVAQCVSFVDLIKEEWGAFKVRTSHYIHRSLFWGSVVTKVSVSKESHYVEICILLPRQCLVAMDLDGNQHVILLQFAVKHCNLTVITILAIIISSELCHYIYVLESLQFILFSHSITYLEREL